MNSYFVLAELTYILLSAGFSSLGLLVVTYQKDCLIHFITYFFALILYLFLCLVRIIGLVRQIRDTKSFSFITELMAGYEKIEAKVRGNEMGTGLKREPKGPGAENEGAGGEREHGNPCAAGRVVEKRKGGENDFATGENSKSRRTDEGRGVGVLTTPLVELDQTQTGRGKTPYKVVTLSGNVLKFDKKMLKNLETTFDISRKVLQITRDKLYVVVSLMKAATSGGEKMAEKGEMNFLAYSNLIDEIIPIWEDLLISEGEMGPGAKAECDCEAVGEGSKVFSKEEVESNDKKVRDWLESDEMKDVINCFDILGLERPAFENKGNRHLCGMGTKMATKLWDLYREISHPKKVANCIEVKTTECQLQDVAREWYMYGAQLPEELGVAKFDELYDIIGEMCVE